MIYVTSDLHGCPLSEVQRLFQRAGVTDADDVYVLGDVIDRGEHGAQLLEWLSEQVNVTFILGNHEAMLLSCDFIFDDVTEESIARLDNEKLALLRTWMDNGAESTLAGLRKLRQKDSELIEGLLDYLRDAPLYEVVEAGGKTWLLVHSGLENFRPDRPMSDYSPDELLWARPTADTRYFSKVTVVFGHTPTEYFGEEYRDRACHGDGWICIDTGAARGGSPMLLRLDDGKEFYL